MMAVWRRFFLRGKISFPKRYLALVLLVVSLPFIVYLTSLNSSERFPFSVKPQSSMFNAVKDFTKQRTLSTNTWTERSLTSKSNFGKMEVHMWMGICGTEMPEVDILRNWPHFPYRPDGRTFITEFRLNARVRETDKFSGNRIFGFIHPQRSGDYKFAIKSDGPSELWLSRNENPASSEMIARVFSPNEPASTQKRDDKNCRSQISKEIALEAGKKYYIESLEINKQANSRHSHVAVYWLYSSLTGATFEIVSSKYLSKFCDDKNRETIPHPAPISPAEIASILHQSEINFYYFHRLPFINKKEYIALLPTCPYSPSFLVRQKLEKYAGVWLVKESRVFPEDDTDMLTTQLAARVLWSLPNPIVDKNKVVSVVDKLVTSLRSR